MCEKPIRHFENVLDITLIKYNLNSQYIANQNKRHVVCQQMMTNVTMSRTTNVWQPFL